MRIEHVLAVVPVSGLERVDAWYELNLAVDDLAEPGTRSKAEAWTRVRSSL